MIPVSTARDALGVDPRANGAPKSNDNGKSSGDSPPFDGVLADVSNGATAASAGSSGPVGAATTANAGATNAAPSPTLDALMGLLAKGAGIASTAAGDGGGDPKSADALAKKGKAKTDASTATQTGTPTATLTTQTIASVVAPDVMSMLMLGAQAKPASSTTSGTAAAGAGSGSATATATATAQTLAAHTGPSPLSETGVTTLANISVATHLAPSQPMASLGLAEPAKAASGASAGAVFAAAAAADGGKANADGLASAGAAQLSASTMALGFAPIRSIASAIVDLASQPTAVSMPTDAPKITVGVARSMTLQMNPPEMGTVGVRLHVTGQTLDVQLTISDPQTLGMVSRDRDTLASALHGQNYDLNSLVIQDGGAAASPGGNNAGQGDTSNGNARTQQGASGFGGSQSGGRQGQSASQSTPDRRPFQSQRVAAPAADESRGGGLFV